jgi:hypothetical protein
MTTSQDDDNDTFDNDDATSQDDDDTSSGWRGGNSEGYGQVVGPNARRLGQVCFFSSILHF